MSKILKDGDFARCGAGSIELPERLRCIGASQKQKKGSAADTAEPFTFPSTITFAAASITAQRPELQVPFCGVPEFRRGDHAELGGMRGIPS